MIPLAFIEDYLSDDQAGMLSVITWFLNQVLRHEVGQQAGAEKYERSETRKAHRNGYKERSLKTRYGSTTLQKPQFREFPFETQVFGRYARVEKALVNAVVESYLQGVSTRRVQGIVQHLGIDQLSPASVSRMAKDLDDTVREFLHRPIEQAIPYLYVDASLRRCLLLQSPRRCPVCHQSGSGSSRRPGRRLPGDPGCESHRLRE